MSGIGIRLGSIAEVDVWGGTAIERERERLYPHQLTDANTTSCIRGGGEVRSSVDKFLVLVEWHSLCRFSLE